VNQDDIYCLRSYYELRDLIAIIDKIVSMEQY